MQPSFHFLPSRPATRAFRRLLRCGFLLVALVATQIAASAQILDTVVFGDAASEAAHGVTAPLTQVITGGLGQPARKMQWDPADTTNKEGGYLAFTAKVDPLKVNYVTLKLWGSESNATASGHLVIYLIENGQLNQVGYRVMQVSEYAPLAWGTRPEKAIPERFYYTTIPLPLAMTQGRSSAQLRVVGTDMDAHGSLPVYRAYVHAGAYFEPAAGDPQGTQPAPAPIRPAAGISLQAALDKARATVVTDMTSWLANGNGDLAQLVDGYSVPWTPAYQNAAVSARVVANLDATCQGHFADPSAAASDWGGLYGWAGERIAKIGAAGFGAALDQVVDLGDPAGPATRRVLWAKMLKASLDAGRYGRRGPTTNQTIINDKSLYNAQRGLVVLGSSSALPAAEATRYLLESVGLEPWLGPDLSTGGRNSFMGTDYHLVTPAGLTKENGYVSAYGEIYDVSAGFYPATGDVRFKTRAVEMLKARSHFRYPMVDENGYRSFRMVGPLDWRAHQSFPFDQAYGERGTRLAVAQLTKDPTAIGYARQLLEDNQAEAYGTDLGSALLLETLSSEPDSGERLPMSEGQPDYAWCDVENGVVAIKRGEELTWIEPYWQSRSGLHSVARAFQITPTTARMATVRGDLQFEWNGIWSSKSDSPNWDAFPLQTANGLVHQAYFGDKLLHATAPADAQATREEFIGRAAFYATRYGRYLVGINMDATKSYVLKTPAGFTSATDLLTKTTRSGTITVGPVSAVVLDLGVSVEANPLPSTPKYIEATGMDGGISVLWETSGGGSSYTLKRATVRDGTYTTLAAGLGANYPKKWGYWPAGTYLDTTAAAGTTYYYKVSAINAAGESYDSPASLGAAPGSAVASVDALPAPWKNVNFAGAGSATVNAGAFTLTGGGGDFWNTADGGHFVYQPLIGDGTLVARLTDVGGAYKTGVMIRGSLAANAPHTLLMRQGTTVSGLRRNSAGGGSGYFGTAVTAPAPVWLKVERQSNVVTVSFAPDAAGAPGTWTVFGTQTPQLGSVAYVGLATTSGSPVFDNVAFNSPNNATPAAPATPSGLTALPGSGNITLSWLPSSGAATYTVRRALVSGGPYNTVVATNLPTTTFNNNGLANGTPYYYVVTATSPAGTSAASAQASGTPAALPAAPTVTVTGTQAVITWSAVSGASSYTVRRSHDGVSWTTLVSGLTATSHTDSGLATGQSYLYSVTALHASGSSGSSPATAGSTVPLAPRLFAADGEGTVARLKWNTTSGATSYRVKRSPTSGGTYVTVGTNLPTPTFTNTGLTASADYYYVVTAVNAAGESAPSPAMKLGWGTGLLAEYFNNTASTGTPVTAAIDPNPANANWGQGSPDPLVSNNNFSIVWTGRIEAPSTETCTFSIADLDDGFRLWINGTAVLDSAANVRTGTFALTAGQKYDIRAQFWDGSGAAVVNVVWSSPLRSPEALPASRLYPATPSVHRATGGTASASLQSATETAANLFDGSTATKWNTGANTSAAWVRYQFASGVTWAVSEYRLTSANDVPARDPRDWDFQGSQDGVAWTTLDSRTSETFTARYQTKAYPIANSTAYAYYRLNITANSGGATNSIQFAELSLLSPAALPAPPANLTAAPGDHQVALNWSTVPGAVKYLVKRAIHAGGPYTTVAEVTSGTGYTDTARPNGVTFYYVVASVSATVAGENSAPVTAYVAPIPAPPSGLTAAVANNIVTLQWNAPAWAASYTVKRSTTSGSGYTNLASGLTSTTYNDSTGTVGATYYYVVTATNASGTSGNSAQVSATLNTSVATASSSSGANENATKAFDATTATKWYNGGPATGWLQLQYGAGATAVVTGYVITSANDVPQRDPMDWQLLGSNDGSTWVPLDTQTAQVFSARFQSQVYAVPNATAYAYHRLNITANAGGAAYGVQLSELVLQTALPSPWSTADIGAVGALGGAATLNGTHVLLGSGADIWGSADEFRYVWQTATGDCSITARVTGLTNTHSVAKAGVMIRETSAANSIHAMVNVTPSGTVEFIRRTATGGSSTATSTSGLSIPYWIRLVRSGSTFTAYRSSDGTVWDTQGTATISMSSSVLIGLPVTSHADGTRTQAKIDNVTVVP